KRLLEKMESLRRYIRREFSKKLNIIANGIAFHNPCISHCVLFAFGACNLLHSEICEQCEDILQFFEQLKVALNGEHDEILNKYKQKLIAWMRHYA
ncbi:15166_t:CDS:1, partial [Gigaspora rosea]